MGDLKLVGTKEVQKVLNKKNNLSAPAVANIQQSLVFRSSPTNNGGKTSIKNQLFPSSRKLRRAAEAEKRRETK